MNIALIGFGNMGKQIAQLIEQNSTYNLVSVSYKDNNRHLDKKGIAKADVAIDFTGADAVAKTVKEVAALGVPLVIGTTGWYEQLADIEKIVRETNIGLVYGQNFSIGANIFFKILGYSSHLFNSFDSYDVYGMEIHHAGKKDSPSGTAKKITSIILENFTTKSVVQYDRFDRKIEKNELHFASVRGGRNPGYHEVIFDSSADVVTLSHQAHNREGFAQGALLAAQFIQGKKGIYTFDEVFERQVK
ncbi:MAG: 4-hydroxy-tetrahydrodipicolinate reductase, partial [Patescibacteria group bacterium]|nr:4-hydroxy-tetrahydrodipicolinate reductase [Patescibacteria group bacterium]